MRKGKREKLLRKAKDEEVMQQLTLNTDHP